MHCFFGPAHTRTSAYKRHAHTALASQSLTLITALLPHVRAALATQLHAKQQAFLMELDRIKQVHRGWIALLAGAGVLATTSTIAPRGGVHILLPSPSPASPPTTHSQEYQEHDEKIHSKLVAMIGELIAHAAAQAGLRERDWDDMANAGACRFVEDVIKGVSTMHRVLYQIVPAAQVQVGPSQLQVLPSGSRSWRPSVAPRHVSANGRCLISIVNPNRLSSPASSTSWPSV